MPVLETIEQPFTKVTLTDLKGKRLKLAKLDKPDALGPEVLVIEDDLDPYYKKFLAEGVLLLRVAAETKE